MYRTTVTAFSEKATALFVNFSSTKMIDCPYYVRTTCMMNIENNGNDECNYPSFPHAHTLHFHSVGKQNIFSALQVLLALYDLFFIFERKQFAYL